MLEDGHKNLNHTLKSVQKKRAEIKQRLKNKQHQHQRRRRNSSSSISSLPGSISISTSYDRRVLKLQQSISDVENTLSQVKQLMNKQKI